MWVDDAGVLSVLAREGDDVSTLTGDPAWLGNVTNVIAAGGDGVVFEALLQHNPDDSTQKTLVAKNEAVFAGNSGGLRVVVRKGDAVPDVAGSFNNFHALSRASGGHHAFLSLMARTGGVTTTDDQVLVAEIAGVLHLVAREGTTLLDGGLTAKSFGSFAVTASGAVIFRVKLNGAALDQDDALYRWTTGGGLELLAREGSAAPGLGLNYKVIQALSVSDAGAVAFTAVLSNDKGHIFRCLPDAGLSAVVGVGDSVNVSGVPRTVYAVGIYSDGSGAGYGFGGMGSAINDLGEVFTVLSIGSGEYVARIYR